MILHKYFFENIFSIEYEMSVEFEMVACKWAWLRKQKQYTVSGFDCTKFHYNMKKYHVSINFSDIDDSETGYF